MSTNPASGAARSGTHPAIMVAAVALTAFAVVGTAALMGWLPSASSLTTPASVAMSSQGASGGVASEYSVPELPEPAPKAAPVKPACTNCGIVTSVSAIEVATVAGAVGGAYAGHQIEKGQTWDVRVKLEDGTNRTVKFTTEPAFRVGDKVRLERGTLVRG